MKGVTKMRESIIGFVKVLATVALVGSSIINIFIGRPKGIAASILNAIILVSVWL